MQIYMTELYDVPMKGLTVTGNDNTRVVSCKFSFNNLLDGDKCIF